VVALAAARLTRPTLIVVDNFEHLHSAATAVAELLDLASEVRVIVTSRTPLRISSEWIFPVEPLASRNGDGSTPAAVELFYERAARFGVALSDIGADAVAVSSIVRRLDGLPLAIELVAARTRLVGIVELDTMLSKSLDAVGSGAADLPDRQRTIRSTIDWSLRGLTDGQRKLFARLAVFPADGTLTQLDHVAGPDVDGDLLNELAVLVDNSLVTVVTDQPGGTRYRQHVLLRDYGTEILRDSGAIDTVMDRLVDHYVAAAPGLGHRAQRGDAADSEISADHSSLVAAMKWSLDHGRASNMVGVVCRIWVYWFNGDRAMPGAQWALAADERIDTPKLDWLIGFLAFQTGDYEQAASRLLPVIDRFDENGDAEWKAMSQLFAGALVEDLGAGRAMLEAAVAQFGDTDFGTNGFLAKLFLSINYLASGDVQTALKMREDLLAWSEAEDMVVLIAWSEWNLSLALLAVGRIDDADDHNRRALAQMISDGYQEGTASAVDLVAVVQFHRDQTEKALRLIGGSDAVWATIGVTRWPEPTVAVAEVLAGAREQLGEAECDRLLSEGRSLSLQALIDLASD
jgi:predicted ATPase